MNHQVLNQEVLNQEVLNQEVINQDSNRHSAATGSNTVLLEARGLRKQYGSLTAVDGIDFDIRRGEIFGLLGPNGAGKTTTIGMLAGILTPSGGTILLDGQASGGTPAARRLLGLVPQELAIYNKLTARENLAFFGELYNLHGAGLAERSDEMLSLVGLADRAGDRADTFSGGMKRRLNLAIGLMHRPQLLMLDEPTVGVDPQSRNHIFEGVRTLNRAGLTVLYTSHYMEEVQALCDRVGIMDGGRLIACDTVSNLIVSHGKPVIEITLGVDQIAPTLLAQLEQVAMVQSVQTTTNNNRSETEAAGMNLSSESIEAAGTLLRIGTEQPNRALPEIILALSAARVPILSLNVKQPSLEDVFLALTGKTLRD